jgi:hypothetical protein
MVKAEKKSDVPSDVGRWQDDPEVRDLKARAQELREEIRRTEAELAGRRKTEAEAPGLLVRLYQRVFAHEIPEAEAQAFAAQAPQRTQAIAQAEGRLLGLRPQLDALTAALVAAEQAAQHRVATGLQAQYQAEAATLLQAYEALAASSTRMHHLYQHALAQFPLSAVYRAPKGYAQDIKHAAGLEPLYDADAIRAQRGTAGYLPAAPWDRAVYGGRFKQVWDGLRQFLGMEVDRGDLSPEGAEALRLHQAQGQADRAKREAAMRQAIKAARERGEILPAYLRAS